MFDLKAIWLTLFDHILILSETDTIIFSSAFVYLENCITYQMMLAIYLLFVADDDAIYCLFIYHFYCIYMLFALFFFVSNQNIFYSTFETPHKHQNNKAFNLNNKFTLMMMMFSQLFPPKNY